MPRVKDTQTAILDAAERLFAEHGFEGVSLRRITTEAGVNIAAINYHYGSKEGLLKATLERRIMPVHEERMRLLDQAEAKAPRGRASIEATLEALVAPALRLSRDKSRGGPTFMRLAGRFFSDPSEKLQEIFREMFQETCARFVPAFRNAFPHLSESECFLRLHFCVGAMGHTMAGTNKLNFMSGGKAEVSDTDEIIRSLVTFLAAGMKAPSPTAQPAAEERA